MKTLAGAIKLKRLWLVMAVAATVAMFAAVGGAASAERGDREGINSRVAEILQVDEQALADAFSQAKEEQAEAAVQTWLDRMVEGVRITQEQAEEFTAWYSERPDWVTDLGIATPRVHTDRTAIIDSVAETLGAEEQALVDAIAQARKDIRLEQLNEAVESGRLTQEQADAIAERIENGEGRRPVRP